MLLNHNFTACSTRLFILFVFLNTHVRDISPIHTDLFVFFRVLEERIEAAMDMSIAGSETRKPCHIFTNTSSELRFMFPYFSNAATMRSTLLPGTPETDRFG